MPNNMELETVHLLMFVDNMYEDLELWYPKLRMQEEGAHVVIAGPEAEKTYNGKHGYPCTSDGAIADMIADDFDGVIIPGGFMPDTLRRNKHVLNLVKNLNEREKMIAAICHGGWISISAGVCKGVRMTGSLGIKDDLVNAGAIWEDAPVVVDRHFICSRSPKDLPQFCRAIVQMLKVTVPA